MKKTLRYITSNSNIRLVSFIERLLVGYIERLLVGYIERLLVGYIERLLVGYIERLLVSNNSMLQLHVKTGPHKGAPKMEMDLLQCVAVCCLVLQCVAVRCSVLQCVAVCCSVLQCVAVCCSVLQCVVVCCSVLQRVGVSCSGLPVEDFRRSDSRLTILCSSLSFLISSRSAASAPLLQVRPQNTRHNTHVFFDDVTIHMSLMSLMTT